MQKIFSCSCVCDETMQIGGVYDSYCMKDPTEDQVFENDTLPLEECLSVSI